MTDILQLIEDRCPNGVEYRKLGDVFARLNGTPITASKMKDIENSAGDIRIFAGGKTVVNAYEKDIPNANIIRVPAVLVQSRGVIDFIFYEEPFTFKNEMWAYTANDKASVKYLYYVLKNNVTYFRNVAADKGSMPQISLGVTDNLEIPVPPIDVQREIVAILDRFTELEAELEAELEDRERQFAYYRDMLLDFGAETERKKLSEIAEIKRGDRVTKSQLISDGEYIVMSGGTTPMGRYSEKNRNKDTITIASYGTAGFVNFVTEDFWANDVCLSVHPDLSVIDNKFLYYALIVLQNYIYENVVNAVPSHIPTDFLKALSIPIPPLGKQREIVEILDKFHEYCYDMKSGLKGEIALRRQQYEYYRDLILNFKRKEGAA